MENIPPWLEEYQWIDFVDTPHEIALDTLVAALMPLNPIQDLPDQQVQAYEQMGELLIESSSAGVVIKPLGTFAN